MQHGTQAFFVERDRARQRVATAMLALSLALLAAQIVTLIPAVHRPLTRLTEPLARRFGFAGGERVVREIYLEPPSPRAVQFRNGARFEPVATRRGGPVHVPQHEAPHARPVPRTTYTGPGLSDQDLMARARARYSSAPVVQSEDLVVERLVRPDYPEDAREQGIEGRVALVALVDTTGTVVNVDLFSGPGQPSLEHAARLAVWQCRFRPYREGGRTREVYAVFRFNFRIY